MDVGSNERNYEKLKPKKRGRSQCVTGGGKAQVNQEYDVPSTGKD
jgi:hypothetical protein